MKKILLLILVCVCFYMPTVSAELYQNRDYNFQMEIPDGWNSIPGNVGQYYVSKKNIDNQGIERQEWARVILIATLDETNSDTATTKSLSPAQRKDLLNDMIKNIVEKYPSARPMYSDYLTLGKNGFLVAKFKNDQQIEMNFVTALFHRTIFFAIFTTNNNSGQYEQQFFDMLKTLRPIVGNNDADEWQEDVKYMRDVAEQDAIASVTSTPIKVTK